MVYIAEMLAALLVSRFLGYISVYNLNPNGVPARVKKNAKSSGAPRDTHATRKRRLQERLKELSEQSEQELAALMQSLEKVKASLRPDKH